MTKLEQLLALFYADAFDDGQTAIGNVQHLKKERVRYYTHLIEDTLIKEPDIGGC